MIKKPYPVRLTAEEINLLKERAKELKKNPTTHLADLLRKDLGMDPEKATSEKIDELIHQIAILGAKMDAATPAAEGLDQGFVESLMADVVEATGMGDRVTRYRKKRGIA